MGIIKNLLGIGDTNSIDGKEAIELINKNKNLLILDVRTKGEFANRSIPNAINIPVGDLVKKLNTLKKYKDRQVLVYCASGMRSKSAKAILDGSGFKEVYNLKNGINSYIRNI